MGSQKVLLLDGGFSNVLNKYCSFDVHHEGLWTAKALLNEQDAIRKAHFDYLEAGVDIIETSSYQASLPGFKECLGIDKEDSEKLLRASVTLAKEAVDLHTAKYKDKDKETQKSIPLIAGSVGPYGAYLRDGSEYTGSYVDSVSKEKLADFHLPRLKCLIEEGVDLIAIETNPSLKEVEVILEMLKQHYPNTKSWVSFSLRINDENRNPLLSAYGDSLKTAFESLTKNYADQLWGFGINCTSPEDISPFLAEINPIRLSLAELNNTNKPKLIVYPNSGQKWNSRTGWAQDPIPSLDSYISQWIELGADVIGGCCQIGPDELKPVREIIDNWNNSLHL